jgi:hypothetical protein
MCNSLGRAREFIEFFELENKEEGSRQVDEIKILDDIPLASLENCTIDNYILFLQKQACDSHVDSSQVDFGSFIANNVIK